MSEVAITKKTSETAAPRRMSEVFSPMSPFGRSFGWSPFALVRTLANEMDRMFHGENSETEIQAWGPAVNVQRCNGSLVVSAELPGIKKKTSKSR